MINKIQSRWAQLNKFENMDPDSARRGRLLNILVVGMAALSALALIIVLTIISATSAWDEPGNGSLLLTLGVFIATSIGLLAVNQISVKYASALFLIMLTITLTFSDTPAEVANGRSSYVFFIPIAISSLLLTPASSFFFALVGGIIIFVLANTGNEVPNFATIISGFMLALVSWLSSRSLEHALKDLRIINRDLDKLVEQKTQELGTTLSRELVLAGRNQAILNSIADGVIVFDENNTAILANPALSRLTEKPLSNLISGEVDQFLDTEKLSSPNRKAIKELMDRPEEATLATGTRIMWGNKTLSTSIARVQNAEKRSIGTVAVFRDITHEAELEKMKNTFVAIVSHELRTPLNAILGYAEMLKEEVYGPSNDKQQNILSRIMTNSQRLLGIVTDLLDQAQIEAGKLKIQMVSCKPTEMLDNLHSVMDKIASDKGINFETEIDPSMPPVIIGDPQRLQQIMVNLANNAVKFTQKGSVRVKVSRLDEKNWQIYTIDTGNGIPKEALEYIFESFRQVEGASTRQHGGVGLGLSIVKQLIELMNGTITVESESGKGSIFTATLPLIVYESA